VLAWVLARTPGNQKKESDMISARKAYAIGQILKKANDLEIKGEIQEAIDEVKKAVDINPEDGNLYNRMGDLYLKLAKKDESIENFRKGVEAFRRDNFPRNALALSKKILRHEPDGFDMYYTIADLLVELDEKPDAAKYMFEYIEKQAKRNKEEEALNAIDYLKSLEIRDDRIQDRILDYYNMIHKGDGESKPQKQAASKKDKPKETVAAATM
jgi:tetratricopeptide (TPR) repeat protein